MLKLLPEHYRPAEDYGKGSYGSQSALAARHRLAAKIARDEGLTLLDSWPMPIIGVDCVVMAVPQDQSVEAVAERLSHIAGVAWSQPTHRYQARGHPSSRDDPLLKAQPAENEWQLTSLHRKSTGEGVRIAVVDSRIDRDHPDLRGQIAIFEDFAHRGSAAPESHGTEVAGIIAAHSDNGIGIAGVAPGARLFGLRACWERKNLSPKTVCDSLSLAQALTFAIEHHAQIVNMSLTGPQDRLLLQLLGAGIAQGVVFVAAYDSNAADGGFPASVPGVVAVSAEGLARPRADVYLAPGEDVPTTEPGGRWYLVSGNSYSAAHVSGLIALMRQMRPSAHPITLLTNASGAIDACGSLQRLAPGDADRICTRARTAAR